MRLSFGFTLLAVLCLAAAPAFADAPAITSFSPAQGPIGTSITVTGTALTGASRATIGGVAAVYRVASATQVIATLPATASGKIVVTTAGGSATSSAVFTVTPGAVVSPAQTHPGANITVTASGMDPYTSMDVFFDTTDVALAVSNGSGIASLTIAVPTNAAPIKHWITFDERSTHKAVQTAITINTDWLQGNYSFNAAGYNPYEGTLDSTSVPNLDSLWTATNDVYSNALPMVESKGVIFVASTSGIAHAFSATGALVWTANFGGFVTNRAPVIYGANVYFANQTNVYAYSMTCGTGGATCAPLWTTAVSSSNAGLTQYDGILYIGGSDGNVYPINPATGALGTPFYAVNTTDGSITTPIAFSAAGAYAYGTANHVLHVNYGNGIQGNIANSYSIGAVAYRNNLGYFEAGDGVLHELGGKGWTATLSGTYCTPTPAVAYGMVFAGDCSYVWSLNAATGSVLWTFSGGYVSGITVANHIVYACASSTIVALNASNGAYLWSGGSCNSAPLVANGTVYGSFARIYAFTIPSLSPNIVRRPPAVASLRRDAQLVAIATPEISALPR